MDNLAQSLVINYEKATRAEGVTQKVHPSNELHQLKNTPLPRTCIYAGMYPLTQPTYTLSEHKTHTLIMDKQCKGE